MSDAVNSILSAILLLMVYAVVPGVMVWGWVRWIRRKQAQTVSSVLSVLGLVLATASFLLALSAILYARSIPGYNSSYPDPMAFIIIKRSGALLSLAATASAVGGVWRPSLLRWHSLVGALGALFFWLAAGMGA